MKKDKQRILIARACGYTDVRKEQWEHVDIDAREVAYGIDVMGYKDGRRVHVPHYTESLDAMHEAEEILTEGMFDDYSSYLMELMYEENMANEPEFRLVRAIHATANQKAEAFLKTIGLWEK